MQSRAEWQLPNPHKMGVSSTRVCSERCFSPFSILFFHSLFFPFGSFEMNTLLIGQVTLFLAAIVYLLKYRPFAALSITTIALWEWSFSWYTEAAPEESLLTIFVLWALLLLFLPQMPSTNNKQEILALSIAAGFVHHDSFTRVSQTMAVCKFLGEYWESSAVLMILWFWDCPENSVVVHRMCILMNLLHLVRDLVQTYFVLDDKKEPKER